MVVDDRWFDAISCQAHTLEELIIGDCSGATVAGLNALNKLTNLKRLHLCRLACWNAQATDALMTMPGVSHLHLEGTGVVVVNDVMATRLGCLKGLEHLALVGASGLVVTGHCTKMAEMCPNLQQVDMSESDIQDEGLTSLLKPLRKLQSISLKGCEALTDKCTQAIAALPKLEVLNLARTGVGDLGVTVLKKLEGLEKLVLCSTKVTDESLKVISSSMKALVELDLSCKRVTDLGLRQLGHLSKLTTLNLSYTQVSDQGMLALRKLPKLTNLSLRWTRITDWAIGQLVSTEAAHAQEHQHEDSPPSSPLSLKRVGKSESSENLPLRRSKSMRASLLDRRGTSRSRELSRGLSRSGDYSQVLQRCRATIDFTARNEDFSDMEVTPTSTRSMTVEATTSPQDKLDSPPLSPTGLKSRLTLSVAEEEEDEAPIAPPQVASLEPPHYTSGLHDDDFDWINSEEEFSQQPLVYRGMTQDTEVCSSRDMEPPAYRDMGCFFEDIDQESLFHTMQFEDPVLRCAEPDFPESRCLDFALEEHQPTVGTATNTTICAPPPTNTTLCAPCPRMGMGVGMFGSLIKCAMEETCAMEEEENDPATLQAMRVLDLSVTDVADQGLSFLSAFSHITSLNLFSTKVTDDGLKHVAKLDNLVDLDLCGTEVSDVGLEQLEGLQSLEILKACGNTRITNDGACHFLEAVEALQSLELRSTSVTAECLEMIAGVLNCRARHSI
eukprot:TRINITY_DN1617_c0_g1_i5.p1 TRINITY_DN1617_c0_g1~~TRINITY_DN1617_c0_g1_i5.p1  ORF type:complete len:726 (+),score=122.29 TRINITY_DN1617_c0_g1_i5:312-2489(+)